MDNQIRTMRALIDHQAGTRADAVFLISPETGRTLTFQQLRDQSNLLSFQLLQMGLSQGDKVAWLLDNGLFTVQLFLGAMYGGFVSVPLNARAGVAQLSYTLDHCDAKAVFVGNEHSDLLKETLIGIQRALQIIPADIDSFAIASENALQFKPLATIQPEDAALLMYTSGSTGQPKAAIHSHRTVLAGAMNSVRSQQLSPSDRSLLVLPLYHSNAPSVTLIPALLSGGSVAVPHRFNAPQFWDWMDEYLCTWSALVPTIVSQLLDWEDPRAHNRKSAFERIRFLRSSSGPLSPSLQRQFLNKFQLLLIEGMGLCEAGNVFLNPLPPKENKIGSPGLAWGFETKIADQDGRAMLRGEVGEVLIRGDALMQGYYKDAEATSTVINREGWLHTGDLAYQDEDDYLFVVGRSKELIIKAGVNIAPRQIDEVLECHPAVLEAAVVGVPDRHLGEDLVAFVVLRTGMVGDEREILQFCTKRLGLFKTPQRIAFIGTLPKGPSGKVQRLRLFDLASKIHSETSGFIGRTALTDPEITGSPANGSPADVESIEQTISEAWAKVLAQPRIDPEDNFFKLGGTSLLAIRCLSLLRERMPVALSLSDFFENGTVSQQASIVSQRLGLKRAPGP